MRGEFRRADGLILQNNVTLLGSMAILKSWARQEARTFWFGLVKGAPDSVLTQSQVNEPTVGTNGYVRKVIAQTSGGWPVTGNVGVENYIESVAMVWTATGNFDKAITRLALFDTATQDPTNPIYALSVPLPTELVIGVATPIEQRTWKYRLYL
jgi:hypothetical protein